MIDIDKEFALLKAYMKLYIELLMQNEKHPPSFEHYKENLSFFAASPYVELYCVHGKQHAVGSGTFDWAMKQDDWIAYRHYQSYKCKEVNVTDWTWNKNLHKTACNK
jgi:hypothetical protein